MQFLKEIREHLVNFETEASEEIHRFIDWLHTKYVEPSAPIVAPPSTNYVQSVASFTPALDAAPAAADPAPVVEPTASVGDAPVQDAAVKE